MKSIDLDNIPQALRERNQFVMWKNVKRGDEVAKLPFQLNGQAAKSNDSKTWGQYEKAVSNYICGSWTGIGFMFAEDDQFTGIDLDGCRDPDTETIADWAQRIIDRFDTYIEVSPSETGVKMFCIGGNPLGSGKNLKLDHTSVVPGKEPGVEIYDKLRYFAVTGWKLEGKPDEPKECQKQIDQLCAEFWPAKTTHDHRGNEQSNGHPSIIDRARKYLAKMPPAISGQDGSGTAFHTACVLVQGFNLSIDDAFPLFAEWNQTCEPPWSEAEMRHKLDDAEKDPGERGKLLDVRQDGGRSSHTNQSQNTIGQAKQKRSTHSQKIKVVTMQTVEQRTAEFIIPGWLPKGSVSMGYGEGGVGKSTVVLDWVARLTTGKPFHNSPNENDPGDVVLILAEDPLDFVVKPRLIAAGADDSRVHVIEAVESISEDGDKFESSINIKNHKNLIDEVLSNVANPLMLVVDPIGQFTPGDMHRDNEVRETIAPLAELAEKYQIAVLMTAHEGKDQSRGAKHRFLGSVAYRNASRSAFWFTDDPEDEDRKLIFHTKSNLGKIMPPMAYRLIDRDNEVAHVEWCSEPISLSADEVVTRRRDALQKPKRAEAKEFIRERLADGNWTPVSELDEAAKTEKIASSTFQRAKRELKEAGEIQWNKDGETGEWFIKLDTNFTNCAF